ncbi:MULTISPECIES: hypothetical protein [Providencia]|uniref:hypothetical protein n=1 Tax=Providencia TaxID=586 RepID=UPI0005B43C3C|nr:MULTISPECIES: hypothetical protein [Providencia]APC12793.1 hypothetical protein RB151_031350 [Providencia rettgeri]AVL72312.1 hypothetical protein CEQ08_00605 [Providencia rettgeri]EJD6042472.1 hypothetical protein [Providencia rettgeri]EJD6539297.1 hypothetical protein [Providencia rettgeri]EJD6670801.1 hypothetical protein [Providencia rettgeri]
MKNKIFSFLVVGLIAGASFIGGVASNYTPDLDIIEKSQKAVEDFLVDPKTAEYKNVKYHEIRETLDHGMLGYVCGEVLIFTSQTPYSFKRFIVKTYRHDDGRNVVSIPIIDDKDKEFPNDDFNIIWGKYCNN